MLDRDQIRALVAREVALIEAPDRRAALEALLIEPRVEERTWDYAWPVVRYPYWVVAEAPDRSMMLVHCDQGFGPDMPWGFLHAPHLARPSLGMDAQWGWYLEEAFVRSCLWTGFVKPDLEESFHMSPEERFGRESRPDT